MSNLSYEDGYDAGFGERDASADAAERKLNAEIAALRSQLDAATKERDEYKTRAQVAESDINRCISQAKTTVPDYPWHTAAKGCEHSTASWAMVGSLEGTRLANDDLHAALAASEAACAGMREALEFYGNRGNHCIQRIGNLYQGPMIDDAGIKARATLADPNGTALLERYNAAVREASRQVHCLYDLLVEAGAPTQQYDFEVRRRCAIESAQKFLRELPHG